MGRGKVIPCEGEWVVQGWPLTHSGDPRFYCFPSPILSWSRRKSSLVSGLMEEPLCSDLAP